MSTAAAIITPPIPTFLDVNGAPLSNGFLYIGVENLDPTTNPITVYWDSAMTVPVVQPIRTIGGYPSHAGSPAAIYINVAFSATVKSADGTLVYTSPSTFPGSGVALQVLLASPAGAGAVVDLSPATGAVGNNQHNLNQGALSILNWMTPGQVAAWQAAQTTYDMTAIINAALAGSLYVKLVSGTFATSSPLFMTQAKQRLVGDSSGGTQIKPLPGFTGATVGGQTYSAVIWYQPTAGNWYDATGWIVGGAIEDITINCSAVPVIGILFNRVTQQMLLKNVHIYYPTIGILSTWYGWCHSYVNCYVQNASVTSIRLGSGCNGVSMIGCYLWGGDVNTPVHLDINGDLYHGTQAMQGAAGNSFAGGAIEGGLLGVRIVAGQCAFSGVDFEALSQGFATVTGYYNPTLQIAGPPTTFTGCQFIGLPTGASRYGFSAKGAVIVLNGNSFTSNVAAGPNAAAFNGSISGSVLTLASPATGTMAPQVIPGLGTIQPALHGVGVPTGMTITSLGTAASWGAAGTYNLSSSIGVVGSEPMVSGTAYLLKTEATGQAIGTLPAPGISESNSTIVGWGLNEYVGFAGKNAAALGIIPPSTRFLGAVMAQGFIAEAGTGITFNDGTTAPLNDYQENFIPPTGLATFGGTSTSIASSWFIKVGKLATFGIDIRGVNLTATNGTTKFTGLPFLPAGYSLSNSVDGSTGIGKGENVINATAGGTIGIPTIGPTSQIIVTGSFPTS